MNNAQNILQRRLFLNAIEIQELEDFISVYRQRKTECDEKGFLQDEYSYHNALKYYRAELAKYVEEQRFVKAELKKLKKPKLKKKHCKGEPHPLKELAKLAISISEIEPLEFPTEAVKKAMQQ